MGRFKSSSSRLMSLLHAECVKYSMIYIDNFNGLFHLGASIKPILRCNLKSLTLKPRILLLT